MCRAPEAAENGLRLDALGNLISITVLSPEQIAKAKEANSTRKKITHALICGPHGQMFGTEAQCLKYWEAWNPRQKIEVSKGQCRAIFPDVFHRAVKTANYPISNFATTFDLVNILMDLQDGRKP